MLNLGIIGAENSHSFQIAKLCNELKMVPVRVPLIWGESRKFAQIAAEKGSIPEIVKDWRDMVGRVDGVMIDHRHPKPHYAVAKYFVEQGVPAFVDKPFTYSLRDAKALLDLADKKKVPICTFSAKPIQQAFVDFKKRIGKAGTVRAFNASGPVDLKSKYGGVFFYGVHQVDAIIEIMGTGVKSAYIHRNLPNGVVSLAFDNGSVATINCIKEGGGGFHWRACTDKGILCHDDQNDPLPYLTSAKIIHKFLKTKQNPYPRERMLATIAVLEAMEKSLKTGKPVKVAKFLKACNPHRPEGACG